MITLNSTLPDPPERKANGYTDQHPLTPEAMTFVMANLDKPVRWLARQLEMMYRHQDPGMTTELWRGRVRYYLGKMGGKARERLLSEHPDYAKLIAKRQEIEAEQAKNLSKAVPQLTPQASRLFDLDEIVAKKDLPFLFESCASGMLWLVLADLHIPAHKPVAIQTACEYFNRRVAAKNPPGGVGIIILGDMLDCYRISGYPKDNPRLIDFPSEVDYGNAFLDWMTDFVKPDVIIWKLGNHEARLDKYLKNLAPELYGLAGESISYNSLFELPKRGISLIGPDDVLHYKNELFFLHGDETKATHNPVSPARTMFMKTRSCTLSAHNHQTSVHVGNSLVGKSISCWSLGCLCEMSVSYRPLAGLDWNHGFAIFDTTGAKWSIENKRIMDELEVV